MDLWGTLANSEVPCEMPQNETFDQGQDCLVRKNQALENIGKL